MAFKKTLIEHSRRQYMTSIPQEELLTSMKDLTPKAYQLLMYYYSKQSGWEFDDSEMSSVLGISERMVKEYRNELIHKEYLYIVKGTITNIFVGRKSVSEFKYPDNNNSKTEKINKSED